MIYNATYVSNEDRPKLLYTYFVFGSGEFPFDMLSYDGAWPANSEDAAAIPKQEKRCIALHSYHRPSEARWNSFLWTVSKTKILIV